MNTVLGLLSSALNDAGVVRAIDPASEDTLSQPAPVHVRVDPVGGRGAFHPCLPPPAGHLGQPVVPSAGGLDHLAVPKQPDHPGKGRGRGGRASRPATMWRNMKGADISTKKIV